MDKEKDFKEKKKTVKAEITKSKVEEKKKYSTEEIVAYYKDKMAKKEVIKGVVKGAKVDANTEEEYLSVVLMGFKGIIKSKDIDIELTIPKLGNFVGREVYFTIKEIDEKNKVIYCSRKEAQKLKNAEITNRLYDGEAFEGQIVNILPHGAYIEIKGVTGLLKNVDFAEDFTAVSDIYNQGDKINVKFKKISHNSLILLEATKKYRDPAAINPDEIEKGQTVLGVIRSIKPFGVFVNIAPYLDVLCTGTNPDYEYEEDTKVQIKINDISEKELAGRPVKRFKGKIVKVLGGESEDEE